MHTMRVLKRLFLATILALLPSTAGIVVMAASPSTVTNTRVVKDEVIPEAACRQDFPFLPPGVHDWKSCHIVSTETRTTKVATPLANMLGVGSASAFNACAGTFYYRQNIYLGNYLIAYGWMEFSYCWGNSDIDVVWGPYCGSSGTYSPYGAGENYCASPQGDTTYLPGVIKHSWYVFPYTIPWWHQQAIQQELLYPGFWSYSSCFAPINANCY